MKTITLALCCMISFLGIAQDDAQKADSLDGWKTSGNFQLLFNQSSFNNKWLGGGTSNLSGNLGLTYDFNYKKGKLSWDNKIIAEYGLNKIDDEEFTKKTSDRLEINSIVGKQIKESYWYWSFFTNFRTQFTRGYEFFDDPVTGEPRRNEITNFMSPGYLQFGPGLLWKKSDDFKVNIAPATSRFVFVDKKFTRDVDGYFGVDQGDSFNYEFGAAIGAYAKFKLMENIVLENILNLYSDYLDDPQNVDIDYTLNVTMTINKYLSTNLIFQAIYDDDAIGAVQTRQVFGLAFNYVF